MCCEWKIIDGDILTHLRVALNRAAIYKPGSPGTSVNICVTISGTIYNA